jgi:hypothetical protein
MKLTEFPRTLEGWKWRSEVASGLTQGVVCRAADRVLTQIDNLVAAFHRPSNSYMRPEIKFQIWVAAGFWLDKVNKPNRFKGRVERDGAIRSLRDVCARDLSEWLQGVPGDTLEEKLIAEFGLKVQPGLKAHDLYAEQKTGMPYLRTEAERRRYKLSFRHGLAYRSTYSKTTDEKEKLVLYDTVAFNETGARRGERDVGLFVMGTNGRIYTGMDKKVYSGGYRHSCYFAGEPVFAAGMLGVRQGRVEVISGSSGHYGPSARHILAVLSRLALYGVNLSRLTVRRINERIDEGLEECSARAFIRAGGWPTGPDRRVMWVDK